MEIAIDLSVVSEELQLLVQWSTFDTPWDSDHIPLLIVMTDRPTDGGMKSRNYCNVEWTIYKTN